MSRKALYDEREHGRLSAEAGGSLIYIRQPAPAEYMLSEAHRQVHRGIKSKGWQINDLRLYLDVGSQRKLRRNADEWWIDNGKTSFDNNKRTDVQIIMCIGKRDYETMTYQEPLTVEFVVMYRIDTRNM